jgi:hypothetical protein
MRAFQSLYFYPNRSEIGRFIIIFFKKNYLKKKFNYKKNNINVKKIKSNKNQIKKQFFFKKKNKKE